MFLRYLHHRPSAQDPRWSSPPLRHLTTAIFIALGLLLAPSSGFAESGGKVSMPSYQTRYYTIYTDLPPARIREAELRMTRMFETYRDRTREFSGSITQRLPFYLFTKEQDYLDAGGLEGSSGIFNRSSQVLMALAGETPNVATWYVVQHEGFHQFAAAVISGDLPIWVNEGLAEYFGEAIFTGDGYVTGVIPDWRLRRIQENLSQQKFRSVEEMMKVDHATWNNEISVVNYDQAWSMVQFLAHGDNGKYQQAFVRFMKGIGAHENPDKAWQESFGSTKGFEAKWAEYWQNLEPGSTAPLYANATLHTLTGALARAYTHNVSIASIPDLEQALGSGAIKMDATDWLPASVFDVALENLAELRKQGCHFTIITSAGKQPVMICDLKNGTRMTGRFSVRNNHVKEVMINESAKPSGALAAPRRTKEPATGSGSPALPRLPRP